MMGAEPCLEPAEGNISKGSVKRHKKNKKEKEEETETKGQEQPSRTTVENLTAERDEVLGKQSANSKKSKRGEASASDQAVTGEGKKRKKEHPFVLEESGQKQQTLDSTVENLAAKLDEVEGKQSGKSKKSKLKRNDVVETQKQTLDATENLVAKRGKVEGKQSSKCKRVSFADSTEMFETEGGDGQGTGGGKRKKKKAAQSKNKGKRVSFADSTEVFETEGGEEGGSSDESKLVHGLRFTQEEDDTLMEAIKDFIEMKQLGEKGLEMFRAPRKHKELLHCWDVIRKSLPHRPHNAIYCRARTLLTRSEKRKWTEHEKQRIRSHVKENGNNWKKLADELGRCNIHGIGHRMSTKSYSIW